MRRKGPKIKELARELGVTSGQLLDRCRAEGIAVQNSITRLEPALIPRIRAWFDNAGPHREGGDNVGNPGSG